MYSSHAFSKSAEPSSSLAASSKASATIAFNVMFGIAIESIEPTIRNSNLFPVKANGEVLFLSVASFVTTGTVLIPRLSSSPLIQLSAEPFSII